MDKIFKTLAAAGILSVNCLSLNAQQLPKECCDPNIVQFNREPMHASCFPYDNENSSIQQTEQSKYFVNLNGDWKFYFAEDPGSVPMVLNNRISTTAVGKTSQCPPIGR